MHDLPAALCIAPPFMSSSAEPEKLGGYLATVYSELEAKPPSFVDLLIMCGSALRLPDDNLLYKAALAVGHDLDRGIGTGLGDDCYHNAHHFREVVMNATFLMLQNDRVTTDKIILDDANDRAKLLFAALVHDFHYEKGGNKNPDGSPAPYRLETIAFMKAMPYLVKQEGLTSDAADIRMLICGTDVSPASKAGSFVRAAHRYHFENGTKPEINGVLAPVLPLLESARLTRMAGLLADADILCGFGFTPEYNALENEKLGREFGKVASPNDTIYFLDNIAEGRAITPAGLYFQPNLERIRAAAEAALQAQVKPVRQTLPATETPQALVL